MNDDPRSDDWHRGYEVGYNNGGNSRDADYAAVIQEGVPWWTDDMEVTPESIVAALNDEERSAHLDHP